MRRLLVLVLLLGLLPACGRFVRSGSEPEPEAAPETAKVGEGVEGQISSTTAPAAPTTAPAAGGSTATTTAPAPAAPNPAVRDDPAGFRLTLTVEGDLDYAADVESFVLKLEVRNTSREPKKYDPNQQGYFAMSGAGRWRDIDCGDRKAGGEPPATLAPGQTVTITARYPGPAERLDKGDSCRRPPGSYVVGAGFNWCPPAAIVSAEGPCDPNETQTLRSAGVPLTLR